jgi:hypothetical protein
MTDFFLNIILAPLLVVAGVFILVQHILWLKNGSLKRGPYGKDWKLRFITANVIGLWFIFLAIAIYLKLLFHNP